MNFRAAVVIALAAACGAPAKRVEPTISESTPAAPPECRRLEGTVIDLDDGGAPIVGAAVNIAEGPLDANMNQVREVTHQPTLTDKQGHFVFDPTPPVSLELLVYSNEYIVRSKLTRRCGIVRIGVHRKAPTADVQMQPAQP